MNSPEVGQDQSVNHVEDRCLIGVAISVPAPHGQELRQYRASFGDELAVSVPTHVTLLPPTEVSLSDFDAIENHLAQAARSTVAFPITLAGSASFRPISPVVYVKLTVGSAECAELEQIIRRGPLKRDLHFDYHPHVTVAHHLPDEVLDRAQAELADYHCSFSVAGFRLYTHGPDQVWRVAQEYRFPS